MKTPAEFAQADSWTALSPTAGRAYSSSDFSRWGHAAAWATDTGHKE